MTTYTEAVAQALHRKAIGATTVTLDTSDGIDWTKCIGASRSGGGALPPDVLFRFSDQGLVLSWYLELQPRHVGEKPAVDVIAVARVLAVLPVGCVAHQEFAALLGDVALDLEKGGDGMLAGAQRSYGAAATLRRLVPPLEEAF
jgi:hypothetical protein